MEQKQALVLFAHGARDPRWAIPFERLAERARQMRPDTQVSLAFLELMSPRLPERVAELVEAGVTQVSVVPVFLGQGGHVLRDLPPLIDELRTTYPHLDIRLSQAVGENDAVQDSIARYCLSQLPA